MTDAWDGILKHQLDINHKPCNGHLSKIDIFIDNSLERFTSLFAAAGHPNCVFKISFIDLQKITKSVIIPDNANMAVNVISYKYELNVSDVVNNCSSSGITIIKVVVVSSVLYSETSALSVKDKN